MLAGLLGSLSRSGLLGAFAGLVFFAWMSRRRLTARRPAWRLSAWGVCWRSRRRTPTWARCRRVFGGAVSEGLAGRLSIWRQTWPVVRDFWPLGTGAGTYQAVMVLYQTMSRYFNISHADNEFLQILAEGGLLLGVPVALALVAGAVARREAAARRSDADFLAARGRRGGHGGARHAEHGRDDAARAGQRGALRDPRRRRRQRKRARSQSPSITGHDWPSLRSLRAPRCESAWVTLFGEKRLRLVCGRKSLSDLTKSSWSSAHRLDWRSMTRTDSQGDATTPPGRPEGRPLPEPVPPGYWA